MKAYKRINLAYIYLAIIVIGVIGQLTVIVPMIYDHYRDVRILSNGIQENIRNNNERLADINRQFLESENRNFHSSMVSGLLFVTIILGLNLSAFLMLYSQMKKHKQSNIE